MSTMLKPYPKRQETQIPWLETVPSHWNMRPGMAVLRERKVKNVGMQQKTVLSLSYGRIVIKPEEKLHGFVPTSFEGYQIVEPGNIIVRPTDLQNDQVSLRVGHSEYCGIITSAYICLEAKADLTADYAYLLLHAYDVKKIFYGLGSGLRQNLDWWDFKRLPIPVPPLQEQEAIVRFIRHLDQRVNQLIQAKRQLIALLNEQKQATIHRAVTRGLDPRVSLKPSGVDWLGDVPAHWRVLPLKAVCEIQSGITLGKDYTGRTLHEYPYLSVANVQAGHTNLAVVKTIRVTQAEVLRCTLQQGDVLMTEGGDPDKLGRGCVWDAQIAPCLHQNHIFAVRPNQSHLAPHFLSALMGVGYARAYFQSTSKQTTNLASTNKTKIGQFKVLLPEVDEQYRILAAINDAIHPINVTISRLEREIELLREYHTRLVSDVVTGKLDVRHLNLPDVIDEPVSLRDEPDDLADVADDDLVEAAI